ncbi:glycine zipper 2TM domain-containing protein [Methylophilus sp. UBA6697]|jgi:osmotically inducible lipoprotein OsmB|uniref:glycine zipper 2TM domain-containing protein n=1 Tax=Methylophilus sp. UBA6697 TaxID=1946902 RepID=UPI000EEDB234|nr:glycine zipper 2TM domain-containing protein [Methylophilus sp. UBA6697]HCU84021.1 osmotically-inducible lipoprotein B [Methylophilus sp.]
MNSVNQKSLHKTLIWSVLLALCLSTTACGSMSTRGKSTALGAGIGAVGGAVLTGGSAIGTVGGAAIGGVIGNQINKK